MSEENKALIQHFVEAAFNKGDLGVADEVYASTISLTIPPSLEDMGEPRRRQGVRQHVPHRLLRRAHHRRGLDRRRRRGGLPLNFSRLGLRLCSLAIDAIYEALDYPRPISPLIVIPALLNGFLANPILNLWLGLALLQAQRP
jgi:hypothetical protein